MLDSRPGSTLGIARKKRTRKLPKGESSMTPLCSHGATRVDRNFSWCRFGNIAAVVRPPRSMVLQSPEEQ